LSRHERTILRIMKFLSVAVVLVVPLLILSVWAVIGWIIGSNSR
jgi:hypothetical protein